jgi:hypothetical protein
MTYRWWPYDRAVVIRQLCKTKRRSVICEFLVTISSNLLTQTCSDILAKASGGADTTENDHEEHSQRKAQKADFIIDHPMYDKTFWLFSQEDRLRNMCQKVVKPAGGECLFGSPPSDVVHTLFQLLILLIVLGGSTSPR